MKIVEEYIRCVQNSDLYPNHYVIHQRQGHHVSVECEQSGKHYEAINFGSNDILSLAQHDAVKQAAIDAIETFGTTNSSCATLCGRIDLHRQLEQEISDFKKLPHTYLFLNAWMALQAVMDGFCHLAIPVPGFRNTQETMIFTDVQNHGCITSSVVNAGNRSGKLLTQSPQVRSKVYRHIDMDNFKLKLKRFARTDDRIVIISDAVFSMDGDMVPLPQMLDILADYPGCVLILDEAHSSGAIGPTGRGIYEHFGLTPQDAIDRGIEPIIMTTFSKFAASAGAAISSYSASFIKLLDACPTSIGTISPPPSTTAAALEAIRQLRKQPDLTNKLREKTIFLRRLLREHDFETLGETNVVPIILPKGVTPKHYAQYMLESFGIWVSPVWFIAKPRIRVVVNVSHSQEDLRKLVLALVKTREAFFEMAESA